MKKTVLIILITFLLTGHNIYAQGCNDAGLCSLGDLDGQGLTFGYKKKYEVFQPVKFSQ